MRIVPLGLLVALCLATHFTAAASEPTAEQMMIRAHRARAEWNDFPGLTARVTLYDGQRSQQGQLEISADGEVQLEVPGDADLAWAERKLASLAAHRMPSGDAEYDVSYADDDRHHPLGRLITFNEDRLHSVYRVKDDVITEVHRTMGKTRFTISVVEVQRNHQRKYLPRTYSVSYWDAEGGQLRSTDTVHLVWSRAGGFDVPQRVTTIHVGGDRTRTVQSIELSDVKVAAK